MKSQIRWLALFLLSANAFQTNSIGRKLNDLETGSASRLTSSALSVSNQRFDSDLKSREAVGWRTNRESRRPDVPWTGLQVDTLQAIVLAQGGILLAVVLSTAIAMMWTTHSVDLASLHWNGDQGFSSPFDMSLSWERVLEGFIVATPLIYLEKAVKESDYRDAAFVNFSTTNMVMSLFGRRRHKATDPKMGAHPTLQTETGMSEMLLSSSGISILAGVSEEIAFRAALPAAVFSLCHSQVLALLVQALVFGHSHISPRADRGENRLMCAMQSFHGLILGTAYLLMGGDLMPCIIAHALYDFHVFVKTWLEVNDQMDYTEEAVLKKLTSREVDDLRKIKLEAGPSLTAETLAFARRFFFAFDEEHKGSLSEVDVQRAISYAFLQDTDRPSQQRVSKLFQKVLQRRSEDEESTGEDRLTLSEFLRLLFVLKANPQPVQKQTTATSTT